MVDECSNCEYYRMRTYGTAPNAKQIGECRVVDPDTQGLLGIWPQVKPSDWCGEWDLKGSDLESNYLKGNLILTTTTRVKLMESTDPTFAAVAMIACQITNVANQPCLVMFYDGDTTNLITQLGCAATQSDQFLFAFPLGAPSGSIWCALRTAVTEVYVAAQGRKVRP